MTDTEIELPYGTSLLKARIPTRNLAYVLSTQDLVGIDNEWGAVINSLRSPIGCPPLGRLVKRDSKVVVMVTDNTRPCPDDRILPPLLAELEKKIPQRNITIITALGLHQQMDRGELIKKLGEDIIDNYNVINHDVRQTVNIGTTSRGTPVDINSSVVEADFRISTGFIEPHFFAGYSGGRKSIAPGVSGIRSVHNNHGYRMIEHPCARSGILAGNPIHEDMLEQARMAKHDFIVNVILNKERQITHVLAGDPEKAHQIGCDIERKIAGVEVDHKVDITITTNGGSPLDLDLYQTCKGIDNAATITRDGGIIIVASSCNAGLGPGSFWELHASVASPKQALQKIRREEPIGVQWQNQVLARTQLKNAVYLVSELEDSVVKDMMMVPVPTLEEGLMSAFEVLGGDAEIAVIPEGPLVLPLFKE